MKQIEKISLPKFQTPVECHQDTNLFFHLFTQMNICNPLTINHLSLIIHTHTPLYS